MKGPRPKFYTSKYFDPETWKLARDAPADLQTEFEEWNLAHSNGGFEPDVGPILLTELEGGS